MNTNLPLNLFRRTALFFFLVVYGSFLSAQTVGAVTDNEEVAIRNAIDAYHQFLSPQTSLYNGSEYVDYPFLINEGIPFFETGRFSLGNVEYDHILYKNIPLLYDEVKDEIVIQHSDGAGKIKLNKENVGSFSILNHRFVKLLQDSLGKSLIRTGFYELLYDGNIKVYKRQTKTILENISIAEGITRKIDEKNEYFIKKTTAFYPITNKQSALRVIQDDKKEIQQYMKKNKLNFRKAKEMTLIKIAAYYDQLNAKQ